MDLLHIASRAFSEIRDARVSNGNRLISLIARCRYRPF